MKLLEIGIDEVGRGCLAGPVVACSVIIPEGVDTSEFKDSKRTTKKKRKEVAEMIQSQCLFGIGMVDASEIDEINILNATHKAMIYSIESLFSKMGTNDLESYKLLIDGDSFPGYKNMEYECIIKGDDKVKCISAASIVAKVLRDSLMTNLSTLYPKYGWDSNAGYGTKDHISVIEYKGLTEFHRKSFCSKYI